MARPRKVLREKGARGSGSVYQLKSGRWGYALQRDGVRVGGSRKTQEGAEKALQALREGVAAEAEGRQDDPLLSAFLDTWLKEIVEPHLSVNTTANYRQMSDQHIKPLLGKRRLSTLRREDVQRLVNTVKEKKNRKGEPLSPKTVKNVQATLSSALQQAIEWRYITENVAFRVRLPRQRASPLTCYTEEQRAVFLEAVKGNPHEAAFAIAVTLGIRKSEILGLEWRDVDMDACTLHVRGSKTEGSDRLLDFPRSLLPCLARLRASWVALKLQTKEWHGGDRLFLQPATTRPLPPRTFYNHYERIIKASGLPYRHFHMLRHTAATLALLRGTPIKTVSRMLGHSDIKMTLQVYAHVLEGDLRHAADRMEDVLEGF